MAKFKVSVKFEGSSREEILELEASTPKEARLKCQELVENNKLEMDRIAKLNIYNSKIISGCELCRYDWKLDVISLEDILGSKDNV